MRTFGVEEEHFVIDAKNRWPVPLGEEIVRRFERDVSAWYITEDGSGVVAHPETVRHSLCTELHAEQVEVVGPPVLTLWEQLHSIRLGRSLADRIGRMMGARVVALASPLFSALPQPAGDQRHQRIQESFGLLATDQLTCGFHVHVSITSRHEGVQILDRIRIWLPVVLALSANSPFWYGRDSGYSSYRYQAWSQWPSAGLSEVYGSVAEYDRRVQALLSSGAALDKGMLYFDARLSEAQPTVEIRIADVALDARHAAVIASLVRALVETASRRWRGGIPAPHCTAAELRAATWRAARNGVESALVSPRSGKLHAAGDVVAELLDFIGPVLEEYGEDEYANAVVWEMLKDGTGSTRQREAYAERQEFRDVVSTALDITHAAAPEDEAALLAQARFGELKPSA